MARAIGCEYACEVRQQYGDSEWLENMNSDTLLQRVAEDLKEADRGNAEEVANRMVKVWFLAVTFVGYFSVVEGWMLLLIVSSLLVAAMLNKLDRRLSNYID